SLRVHQDRVWVRDPDDRHIDNPNSPFLVARPPRESDRRPMWDIFRGLRRVVTEHPSCLEIERYTGVVQQPLASFPRSAYFTANEPPPPAPNRNPFPAGGVGPDQRIHMPYRFLAMADQAVLLNRLIADPTTENLELARRVVTFLQDPEGVHRTKCLF